MYFLFIRNTIMYGGIGEVVNTPDCGSGMHGFDPHIPPHIVNKGLLIVFFSCYDMFISGKGVKYGKVTV